jgi:DNA-binding NarL/FixJ family response regulator
MGAAPAPALAANCRWRQAEALVATGASRAEASRPLRLAYAVAARIGATPLAGQFELLAKRAAGVRVAGRWVARRNAGPGELLGLTPREAEVLALVARGYTNPEIAATHVIRVRTAGVYVSHILRKLGAPNRLEAPIPLQAQVTSATARSSRSDMRHRLPTPLPLRRGDEHGTAG